MEKITLEPCILTEHELVNLFGNNKQKESYHSHNGFSKSGAKKLLLDEASRYGTIIPLERRMYKITSIHPYVVPKNYKKMNTGIYQYMIPIILNILMDEHEGHDCHDFTIGQWARRIGLVNNNYNLVKYNPHSVSEDILLFPATQIQEFFNYCDSLIDYYIRTSIRYLEESGIIEWRNILRVKSERIYSKNIIYDITSNKMTVRRNMDDHRATEEEQQYYIDCVEIADKTANVKNESERHFSKKAKKYNLVLHSALAKKNIKYVYHSYEIISKDIDKCKYLYSLFDVKNIDKAADKMTMGFTKKMKENAKSRYRERPLKYLEYGNQRSYVQFYSTMCDVVINRKTEYLGDRLNSKENEIQVEFNKQEVRDGITV